MCEVDQENAVSAVKLEGLIIKVESVDQVNKA
jgi:hypothetical protein